MTEKRNYVAAWVDKKSDKIVVIERDESGARHRVRYNPPYYFYIPDEEGEHESIFGDKLTRAEFDSREEYEHAKRHFPVKFESDIPPLKRVLMDYYYGREAPIVNYAFIDIENDYSKSIGWASPTNPYAVINAVTVYQSWTGKYLTYIIPPSKWKGSIDEIYLELHRLIADKQLEDNVIPEFIICIDELDLLTRMCAALEDADILSGWNSEFYDIPYICERLLVNGGEILLSKLDHLGTQLPKKDMVNRFGSEEPIYKLNGKSHVDYMDAIKKFTFTGRSSYALGNILEEEIGIGKIEYSGTLEELYNNNFALFSIYNFRDVSGLVQLDQKFKFISLINQMAHENTVNFSAMLGTVAYVETGITNHAHNVLNKIVHDKVIVDTEKVEGAIVMTPQIGLHEWIGSVDINSLYPNVIRSLNISPEMVIGQFEDKEIAWRDIRDNSSESHMLMLQEGGQRTLKASEWKEVLKDNQWAISAYGTVFNQSRGRGAVADILGFWYSERKRLQEEKKKWSIKVKQFKPDTPEYAEAVIQQDHFDLLQLTKKISMNSLFGALLNKAFKFGSESMGASTTATGRQITTFMIEGIGEFLTGERIPLVKTTEIDKDGKLQHSYSCKSDAIIYGDTDSLYFKTWGQNKEEAVEIADMAAEKINKDFPSYMRAAFNCQPGFDTFIKAGRELVGIRGLFQAKKKYMIKIVDLEGFAVDKMKSMGSEIKKSDTPKPIQTFLKTTTDMILEGRDYETVATYINEQRKTILKNKENVFLLGIAKQINNLDKFEAEYNNPGTVRSESGNKLTVPGHVRASLNYNYLLNIFDKGAKSIRSGDKAVIFYLKPNEYQFDTIAFPSEFVRFPKWFDENFKIDIKKTEGRMFDSKLSGIFAALGKDVPSPQSVHTNSILEF
jgi:DNA polymerase elongation subunit (family B)